jgi:hypothetical protein
LRPSFTGLDFTPCKALEAMLYRIWARTWLHLRGAPYSGRAWSFGLHPTKREASLKKVKEPVRPMGTSSVWPPAAKYITYRLKSETKKFYPEAAVSPNKPNVRKYDATTPFRDGPLGRPTWDSTIVHPERGGRGREQFPISCHQ